MRRWDLVPRTVQLLQFEKAMISEELTGKDRILDDT
jgi:hypothetical protein